MANHLTQTQEGFDILGIHLYPDPQSARLGHPGAETALLRDIAALADCLHKPLFVGEFGTADREFRRNVLHALSEITGASSAFWIWEYYPTATYDASAAEHPAESTEPGLSNDILADIAPYGRRAGNAQPTPRIVLNWPLPCARIDHPIMLHAVGSDGTRGVAAVEFRLDEKLIGRADRAPFQLAFDPRQTAAGKSVLSVTTHSASGHTATDQSTILLNDTPAACAPAAE